MKSLHNMFQNHNVISSEDFSNCLILQTKSISKHFKVTLHPETIFTKQFVVYEKG